MMRKIMFVVNNALVRQDSNKTHVDNVLTIRTSIIFYQIK